MLLLLLFFAELVILYFFSKKITFGLFKFFYRVTKNKNWASYLLALVYLPGTFVHEMSHVVFALFLLVPFGEVEFLPEIHDDGVKMGSVGIGKTDPVRRFLIGIAPFVLGTLLLFSVLYYSKVFLDIDKFWTNLLIGYFVFCIGNTMFASRKDLEGALQLFLFLIVVYLILFILGINFPFLNFEFLSSPTFTDILKEMNIYLLLPLGIDLLFFLVFGILKS